MIAIIDKQSGGVKYFKPDGTVTPIFLIGPVKGRKMREITRRIKENLKQKSAAQQSGQN